MSKYLLAFRGGKMPDNPEAVQAIMAEWEKWMSALGSDMIDPGSIVGNNKIVSKSADQSIPENSKLSGYMLISSTSMDAALAIANSCPILKNQGSIEVAQLMSPP